MDLYIPNGIKTISRVLNENGFQCFLVGGAIRNQLLGKKAKDFDLTTDATPDVIINLFKKVIPTGIKHGTVTILIHKEAYEITTYRIDGKYTDGRRPDKIEFTPSIEEDLIRRDFTINSIAFNIETEELLDINGGIPDLKNSLIRAIGEPKKRFQEDALRLVRACRFSSQLNFKIDDETYEAIKTTQEKLGDVSKERIAEELNKILLGNNPSIAFVHFYKTGMLDILFPEFSEVARNNKKLFYSALKDLDTIITSKPWVRFSRLINILPEEQRVSILRNLKLSNNYINSAIHLSNFIEIDIESSNGFYIRELLSKIKREYFEDFLDLLKGLDRYSINKWENFKDRVDMESNYPLSIKELAINGQIVMKQGVKPGPEVGSILEKCLKEVLKDPANNNEEYLISLIIDLKRS